MESPSHQGLISSFKRVDQLKKEGAAFHEDDELQFDFAELFQFTYKPRRHDKSIRHFALALGCVSMQKCFDIRGSDLYAVTDLLPDGSNRKAGSDFADYLDRVTCKDKAGIFYPFVDVNLVAVSPMKKLSPAPAGSLMEFLALHGSGTEIQEQEIMQGILKEREGFLNLVKAWLRRFNQFENQALPSKNIRL